MTGREASLVERLSEAENPRDFCNWEGQDGYYVATCRVLPQDIPGLIDLARKWIDLDWPGDAQLPQIDDAELLPITAWRTLADMKAEAAVQPLVEMLCELNDELDDWACEDLPHVFGKIGESAIEPLVRLAGSDKSDYVRSIAVGGLRRVADYYPETSQRIVACLTEMMTDARAGHMDFNTALLTELVALGAAEAAEPIERAFAADLLDVGMMGNWEAVRRELGVQGLGLEMPVNPYNSFKKFRLQMGVGIFSSRPIFAPGDIDHDAEQAYYERARKAFSKSNEARQVVERYGDLGWYQTLLEFGIRYLGEVVDEMTLGSVQEFVLDFVPRKVSTEADSAASIVFELAMFWQYLHRVYELPAARSIIDWLRSDGVVARLTEGLSDSSKFGMAKSLFTLGKQAGYDMTSEAGLAQFIMQYNQSLASNQPAVTRLVREQRVGRNAPCPCGSGKKFKKCCGR